MVQKVKQVFQLTQFAGRTTNIAVCGSKLGGISAEGSRRFRGQTTIRSPRMHDGNLAAQEVAAECQGDTLTCTNSSCRNPKGSVLPRECFIAEAHGRTITYRTCSFCRVKDSLKKRQRRAATIQDKDTLRVLECHLADLSKEHQRLKKENLRLRTAPNGIAEGRPWIGKHLTDTDLNAEFCPESRAQSAMQWRQNDLHSTLSGPTPSCDGFTELMHYASVGDPVMVTRLIDQGHDPLIRTQTGCTALHLAVKHRKPALVRILLSATQGKLNINWVMTDELHMISRMRQTWVGTSLLHLVSVTGDVEIAQILLNWKANPNLTTHTADGIHSHVTALHICASFGHASLCALLLRHGADGKVSMIVHCAPEAMPGEMTGSFRDASQTYYTPTQLAQGQTQHVLTNWTTHNSAPTNHRVVHTMQQPRHHTDNTKQHIPQPQHIPQHAYASLLEEANSGAATLKQEDMQGCQDARILEMCPTGDSMQSTRSSNISDPFIWS